MKKNEIIDLCRRAAKIRVSECLEAENAKQVDGEFGLDLGLDDRDMIILGFKEDVEHNCYILIFKKIDLNDLLCYITYDINTKEIESKVFKFMNL